MMKLTDEIHKNGPSKEDRNENQYPGQVGCLKCKQAKEVVAYERVAPAPHIDYHCTESFSQEEHLHTRSKGRYQLSKEEKQR